MNGYVRIASASRSMCESTIIVVGIVVVAGALTRPRRIATKSRPHELSMGSARLVPWLERDAKINQHWNQVFCTLDSGFGDVNGPAVSRATV